MTANFSLMAELHEIEDVTEVNGCFLLRASDNKILDSTIPLKIHPDILWEISVLRDTFQQFSEGVNHGELREIMLEGDRGFIFLYRLSKDFILLLLAPKDINLGYFKLGMIDISAAINKKINAAKDDDIQNAMNSCVEDELLAENIKAAPVEMMVKSAAKVLETDNNANRPQFTHSIKEGVSLQLTSAEEDMDLAPPVPKQKSMKTPTEIEKMAPEVQETIKIPNKSELPIKQAPPISMPINQPIQLPTSPNTPLQTTINGTENKSQSIEELLKNFSKITKSEQIENVRQIFDLIKKELGEKEGAVIANTLLQLKDEILNNWGTSLVLFDISKTQRNLKNMHCILEMKERIQLFDRIDNWAQRLLK